jgi:cAMP-dependent protein kinase regulator
VKKIVPKSESVKQLIYDAIKANILFKACSEEELDELVDVFEPREASAGSIIIREGDEGDAFYVMERGTVDVYEGEVHKTTLYSGTSFGEIALLYGCPRSATLRARYFCKLWSISRTAFRAITSQFKRLRMEAKVDFLKKVCLLTTSGYSHTTFVSFMHALILLRTVSSIPYQGQNQRETLQ